MTKRIDLLTAFEGLSDPEEVFERAVEVFAEFGEGWLAHSVMDPDTVSLVSYRSNLPTEFFEEYAKHDAKEIDYLSLHVLASSEFQVFSTQSDDHPERAVLNRILSSHGIRCVPLQPVPAQPTSLVAGVPYFLASPDPDEKFRNSTTTERFQLAAFLFNAAYTPTAASATPSDDLPYSKNFLLTVREHQALTLLAQGRRTAQIAAEMGVSEAAVKKFHALARGKLGAKTMTQAAAIAAQRRLIAI